jgi:HlyD family secretion protein
MGVWGDVLFFDHRARRRTTIARSLSPSAFLRLSVLVCTVSCSDDGGSLRLVGSVERTLIELSAATSEVIVSLPVERGRHVRAGETVVKLDPTLVEAEVARVEAEVAGARTGQAVTRHDLARARELHRGKIVSADQLEHAELAWDEASAKLKEAEARRAMARKRLADLTIESPAPGVVDQIPYDLGERVPAGAVVAVVLQDEDPWVRVWVPERAVARLSATMAADVEIDGLPHALRGRILDVAREPEFTPHYALTERERGHLVYETRVRIEDAPPGLRPGAAATVVIPLEAGEEAAS